MLRAQGMSWPLGEPGGKKVLEKSSQGTSPSECGKGLPSLLTRAGGWIGVGGAGGRVGGLGRGCRGARAPQFHHPPGWSPWQHPWGGQSASSPPPGVLTPIVAGSDHPKVLPYLERHLLPSRALILPLGWAAGESSPAPEDKPLSNGSQPAAP